MSGGDLWLGGGWSVGGVASGSPAAVEEGENECFGNTMTMEGEADAGSRSLSLTLRVSVYFMPHSQLMNRHLKRRQP